MVSLTLGTRIESPEQAVQLTAARFNRHTFWCGQSGSDKTYAFGVVLEQLLLHTKLPLVILDPNSDFTRIHEPLASANPAVAAAIAQTDIRVFHSTQRVEPQLRTRFVDLSVPSKAAVLRLDPIADLEEYNILVHVEVDAATHDDAGYVAALRHSGDPGKVRLATRVENLQVLELELWSRGHESVIDIIDTRPRAAVLDLGGFAYPPEPKVAALSVLEHLWAKREERRPLLIVIDEAHNICPPNPGTSVERALTELVIQIAAEGRKFGPWLLLSTQRPTKIHPQVLSQCDNLGLMRMNSSRDLAELADVTVLLPSENRSDVATQLETT